MQESIQEVAKVVFLVKMAKNSPDVLIHLNGYSKLTRNRQAVSANQIVL